MEEKHSMDILELKKHANDVRKGIIEAVHGAKAGHPGGSLSAADIFTYLYFEEMNIDPENPKMEDRDRFVLSKGHTAPGLYSTLAHRGYFPVADLPTLRHLGSYLQGTSLSAACAGSGHVLRLSGPGDFRGCGNGYGRKAFWQGLQGLHAVGRR